MSWARQERGEGPISGRTMRMFRQVLDHYGLSGYELSKVRKRLIVLSKFLCMLCGRDMSGGKVFNLDHDHKTQEIRGVLCWRCNRMLGTWTASELRRAADYIDNPPARLLLPEIIRHVRQGKK